MRFLKRKKFWLTLLLFALVTIPLYHVLETYRSRGKEKAVGIYLVHGGQSFVWIDLDEEGELVVRDGYFYTHSDFYSKLSDISLTATFQDGDLILQQEEAEHSSNFPLPSEEGSLNLRLRPSENESGDWDLIHADYHRVYNSPYGWSKGGPLTKEFYDNVWFYAKAKMGFSEGELQGELPQSDPPLRSFLHRVDDERLVEYMKKRLSGDFSEADLNEFREFASAFPEDPYVQMHAMEVGANYGDMGLAEEMMEKWEGTLENSPDVLLREISQRAIKAVWKAMGDPRGDDLLDVLAALASESNDLEERLEILDDMRDKDYLLSTTRPVVEPISGVANRLSPVSTVGLELQSQARVFAALADLDLVSGDRSEALRKMGGTYKLGETMNSDGPIFERLIGIAIRLIAMSRMERQLVNACETREEIQRYWKFLESNHSETGLPNSSRMLEDEWGPFMENLKISESNLYFTSEEIKEQRSEFLLRNDVTNMRYEMLRVGAAAKLAKVRTGHYPTSAGEFAPLLPDGSPQDVFSGEPIRFIEEPNGDYSVYSVGPDEDDDSAMVSYSPTNGSTSNGDLILEFEREREYPFSSEGLSADSATDALAVFHHGFPWDPFAGNGAVPLSVFDATANAPVRVFSFGPAGDAVSNYCNFEAYQLPDLSPVNLESATGRKRLSSSQWVFFHSNDDESQDPSRVPSGIMPIYPGYGEGVPSPYESGFDEFVEEMKEMSEEMDKNRIRTPFTLGPRYSPTNGIKSEGHLWIDLPRRRESREDAE